MRQEIAIDRWMWQMYRRVAEIIHQPSVANEERLRSIISEYRAHWEKHQVVDQLDPHERVMDYL